MASNQLIALFGPTASGKTALAVELAERLRERGEDPVAVSADSIAIYRELPLISGAPEAEQLERLEHRLVGIRSVTESFSAGEFSALAHEAIDELMQVGRQPILVGGTGLYMRAAVAELELRKPVDGELRESLQRDLQREGSSVLHERLKGLDPEAAARIVPSDGRRVTRALELLAAGSRPPAPSDGLWGAPERVPTLAVAIVRSDDELKRNIAERARRMIDRGVRDELLAAERLGPSDTARAALGWNEALAGDVQGLATRTWQLARRQRTWLRKMDGFETVDLTGLDAEAGSELVLQRILGRAEV